MTWQAGCACLGTDMHLDGCARLLPAPLLCRKWREPTRAGLWTGWCCTTTQPTSSRRMSLPRLRKVSTCTGSSLKEQAGTARTADLQNLPTKSSLFHSQWCTSMQWTTQGRRTPSCTSALCTRSLSVQTSPTSPLSSWKQRRPLITGLWEAWPCCATPNNSWYHKQIWMSHCAMLKYYVYKAVIDRMHSKYTANYVYY